MAAVVHHGGAGTTTTAARAGAPQVVVPQKADQPDWAGRVAGTIRTDGATLLLHAISRERPPASAMTTTIALTDTERAYLQGQRSAASPP